MSSTAFGVSHRILLHHLTARWRVVLLALVTTLVWTAHYDRWTLASWSVPTDYRGDSLEIFARIQAAAEGNTRLLQPQVIARLGAPFGANWSAYPTSDLPLVCVLGWLARGVGVFAAANLALLLATVSAALAFEQFGYGFGFTAYMVYMLTVAEGEHKTAHYAICTGFMALGMMLPGMAAGWIQSQLGYLGFFVWVCVATLPSFLATALVRIDPGFGAKP